MELSRESLPGRRGHEVLEFDFSRGAHDRGHRYTAAIGRYPDGRIGEVFLDCHKLSSAMTDDARDVAMTVSIALQHGVPLGALAGGLAHYDDGRPCGLIGKLIDEVAAYESDRRPGEGEAQAEPPEPPDGPTSAGATAQPVLREAAHA